MLGFALDAIFTLMAIRAVWKLLAGCDAGDVGPAESTEAISSAIVGRARAGRADGARSGLRHVRRARSCRRDHRRPSDTSTSVPPTAAISTGRKPHEPRISPRGHRRDRPADVRARLHGEQRRQHQRASRRRAAADDAEERLQGLHDARHDVRHGSQREENLRRSRSVVRSADAPRGVSPAARRQRRGARASADGDRLRRCRHPARPRGPRRGADDARAAFRLRSTRRRPRPSCRRRCASTSRRTTACCSPTTAR